MAKPVLGWRFVIPLDSCGHGWESHSVAAALLCLLPAIGSLCLGLGWDPWAAVGGDGGLCLAILGGWRRQKLTWAWLKFRISSPQGVLSLPRRGACSML